MHIVECPSCSSLLKVPKPVSNARLKCRKCGVVFAGTSREVADPPTAAPVPIPAQAPRGVPRAAASPMTFRAPPPRNNNVVFITIGVGVVMLGLIIAVVVKINSRPTKPPVEEPKVAAPAPVRRPAPPSGGLFSISGGGSPATPPAPRPESPEPEPSPPRPAAPDPAAPPVAPRPVTPPAPAPATPPAPPAPTLPENLPVECRVVKIGLPGSEQPFLQGGIRNDRAEGLRSATIEIRLPDGGKQKIVTIECSILAPQGRLPFLVPSPVPLEEGAKPEAVAISAVPLGPNQVCWLVEEAAVKGDETAESRTVTGSVRNLRDVRVSNIEVYADVYFGDGRSAGTVKGRLEHGNMLDPGGRDDFSLPFTPSTVGTHMQRPIVRVVGSVP